MKRAHTFVWLALCILMAEGAAAQQEEIFVSVLNTFRHVNAPDTVPHIGLFVSTDKGSSWRHLGWRDYSRVFYSEEAIDRTLWSACGNGVLRSTDHGVTWRVTTGWEETEVLKVKAAEKDPSLVFASTPYGVFRSTDKGNTWERKINGFRRPFSADVCIDRTNSLHVLAATEEGMYVTNDAGEQWVAAGLNDLGVRVVVQDPHDPNLFWAGTEESGVFCSSNGGIQWEQRSKGLDHPTVYTIAMHPTRPNWIYVGTFGGGVYRSTNAGVEWQQCSRGLTDLQVHALIILPSDPLTMFAGTLNKGVFRSTDGGETWRFDSYVDSQVWGLSVRSWK